MWWVAIAGITVGSAVSYLLLRKGDDLSKVAGDSWKTLKNWSKLMEGELSSVSAYLAQFRLMHAIGETYLRIEDAVERGSLDRSSAERLHKGLLERVRSIAGEDSPELIAQSVALAEHMRKTKIPANGFSVDNAEELLNAAKEEAIRSGLYDRVLSETERRLVFMEDLAAMQSRNQFFNRR